jgi:hypothetical protein
MKHISKYLSAGIGAAALSQLNAGVAGAAIEVDTNNLKGYANNMGDVINGVLSFVMVIAALLVLFYLIWGGIEWITSGGDKGKTESARNKITAAVIGIIILAASFAILQLVLTFLGLGTLNEALKVTPISAPKPK